MPRRTGLGFLAIGVSTLIASCHDPTAVCDPLAAEAAYSEEAVEAANGERTWQQSVEEILARESPDAVFRLAFGGLNVPQSEFADLLRDEGGQDLYFFQSMPAISAKLPVQGLEKLYPPEGRYSYVSIGRPGGGFLGCS